MAEPRTPLTGSISTVSFAMFKRSIAVSSVEISFNRSLERRPMALNMLLNPML